MAFACFDWDEVERLVEEEKTHKLVEVVYLNDPGLDVMLIMDSLNTLAPEYKDYAVKSLMGQSYALLDTNPVYCPIHTTQRMQRHEKDGDVWYSHFVKKVQYWCNGKR